MEGVVSLQTLKLGGLKPSRVGLFVEFVLLLIDFTTKAKTFLNVKHT